MQNDFHDYETGMKVQIFPQCKMNVLNVKIKTFSFFKLMLLCVRS